MSFTDYLFLPLFALFLLIYFLTPRKGRWVVLLVASILFFCTYGAELLPFAVGSVFIAWLGARVMQKRYNTLDETLKARPDISREEKATLTAAAKKFCKTILWLAVAAIMGLLIYTKIQKQLATVPLLSNAVWFFSKLYQHIVRWGLKLPLIRFFINDTKAASMFDGYSFFVPLGISYYTMSLTGYLADVYWRKESAEKNFFRLALFALYFPKILEGPISKHRNLAKQLAQNSGFDYVRLCHGLQRMLWGFFKKLCIADRLNLMVSPVFSNYASYHGSVLLVAAVFGAFQLYCDFSGCMDIALGASEILGIQIEENFRQPFRSETAAEFWRRWHITLGVWFKDYIYMPLVISPHILSISGKIKKRFGKNAGKALMSILPLPIVWLLTGLWHGTGWNYVLWGVYWGTLIILSNVFGQLFKNLSNLIGLSTKTKGYAAFRRLRTFALFVIGRLIVLPGNMKALATVLSRIFFQFAPWHLVDQSLYDCGLNRQNFWLSLFLIGFLLVVEKKQADNVIFRNKIDTLAIGWRWLIYLTGIFFVLIFGIYGAGYDAASFVYMNY